MTPEEQEGVERLISTVASMCHAMGFDMAMQNPCKDCAEQARLAADEFVAESPLLAAVAKKVEEIMKDVCAHKCAREIKAQIEKEVPGCNVKIINGNTGEEMG